MLGPALKVRGGVSAVVASLLTAFEAAGCDVGYISTHLDGPRIVKAGAALVGMLRLLGVLLLGRCDVVHVHMGVSASFRRKSMLLRMAHSFRRRTVVHIHGSRFDCFFAEAAPARKRAISHALESADLVVALSEEWRVRLSVMAPAATIRVLMNPVVCADFDGIIAERPPVPPDGGTVLFMGAFGRRKGVFDLVEAGVKVAERRPNVVFELGGDQAVDELRRMISELEVERNVRVLGWVRGRDKWEALRRAHVFVLPSYHEGLPIAVLEALAAGLPLVTTPVGGIPEVVKDGVNGILIAPGDVDALAAGILRLLDDDKLRGTMAETNSELARRDHDAAVVARQLCLWYDEIVKTQPVPRAGARSTQ